MDQKNSLHFYSHLSSFSNFESLAKEENFFDVPADWFIIISDIKGSTRAIEEGRYKDVNTIGAATIACIENSMAGIEFPFVFGGDGATALIPREKKREVTRQLNALQRLSQANFDLELRVGLISVSDVLSRGYSVRVAKFLINQERSVAFFNGGGLSFADEEIKAYPEKYEARYEFTADANLTGLSCRWEPIQNKRGTILSLLVKTQNEAPQVYENILEKLKNVLDNDLSSANPVATEHMTYKPLSQCFKNEVRMEEKLVSKNSFSRFFEILMSCGIFHFNQLTKFFGFSEYKKSISTHSDYRKFDDMLRMVIDCNSEQEKLIKTFLEQLYRDGEIYYGTHCSDSAMMTCLVQNTNLGGHIHFIDGGNGGYAMAAKQMKEQMKDSTSSALAA